MSIYTVQIKDLRYNYGNNLYFRTSEIKECPKCHKPFVHSYSTGIYTENKTVEIFQYCKSCKSSFITIYINPTPINIKDTLEHYAPTRCEPVYPENKVFSDRISNLSPMFKTIYNQANAAESHSLDEIAGMGYRKALEFLVKDFCIYLNPNDKTNIEKLLLGKCISTYIPDDKIKNLATASAWLGNDETHYVKKHQDKDIQDLKRFIDSLLFFIEYQLTAEEATSFITAP